MLGAINFPTLRPRRLRGGSHESLKILKKKPGLGIPQPGFFLRHLRFPKDYCEGIFV
jgi:hypothetical protein